MFGTTAPKAGDAAGSVALLEAMVGDLPEASEKTTYDEVPYNSYPYPQSRPERLAAIATCFGMNPASPARCRVLELGCSSGGNLIPWAEQFPESTFVGIDASARQIADGSGAIEKLGLGNIRLEHRNILDLREDFGEFDYIIAHGVYSWVPPAVQDQILEICSKNLSADGVAYVSYNTYPGWRTRGVIRDMMLYRAKDFENPADRVRQARAIIDFVAQSVPTEKNPYGMMLRAEVESLRGKDESYLFHDHLEECNDPIYFHQFVDRARSNGLQYLGEADGRFASLQNLPPQVANALQALASDPIQIEQYMDFIRNRMFRQTLLCHQNVALDREISTQRVLSMYAATSAKPEAPLVDVRSQAPAVFKSQRAVTKTTEPLVKAALLHCGQVWPQSVAITELISIARSRVSPDLVVVDTGQANFVSRRLLEPLIGCYSTGQVEFSVYPPTFTAKVSERPLAPAYARLQAESSHRVTSRRHELVNLNDLQRHVLRHLDGQHDRAALLEKLADLVATGLLVAREGGQRIDDREQVKQMLAKPLASTLEEFTRLALLIA